MRCKICDTIMDKPVWNRQLNDWEVCTTCLEIIYSVFEDAPDVPEDAPSDEEIILAEEGLETILEISP